MIKQNILEVLVKPETVDLAWCKGVVPSPKGDIEVHWEKAKEFSINMKLPLDIQCIIELPQGVKAPRITLGDSMVEESASGRWRVSVIKGRSISTAGLL